MKYRTIIFILLLMLVFGYSAHAEVKKPEHHPDIRSDVESFEDGTFPALWTVESSTPGSQQWEVVDSSSFEYFPGDYIAAIQPSTTLPQDVTLSFDYELNPGNNKLSFYMAGDRRSDLSENVTETVEIISAASQTVVFDFDGATETDLTLERFDVDLSAWDGQTVNVVFRYNGINGSPHYLDAVTIDDGTGWIFIPPEITDLNDDCYNAHRLNIGPINISGNTSNAHNNFQTAGSDGCTGYIAEGPDLVYEFYCLAGSTLWLTMTTTGWDDSIYIVSDCYDPVNTCLAGADLYPTGSYLEYTSGSTEHRTLYLIVDGYSSRSHGDFVLEGYIGFNGKNKADLESE